MHARRRWLFVSALIGLCFVALEVRLFHLQILGHPVAADRAGGMQRRTDERIAHRGRLLDRNGHVLAESVPAIEVYADARWTGDVEGRRDALAATLAGALELDELRVREALERPGYRKIVQKPIADGDLLLQLQWLKRDRKLPGIDLEQSWIRRYPEEMLAAQVLGFVNTEAEGAAGIELRLEDRLRGDRGSRTMERDAAQRPMWDVDCAGQEPFAGADAQLSLDVVIQYFVEDELDRVLEKHEPRWATAVVLRPATGDVLAMASRPTFDPNIYAAYPVANHTNEAASFAYVPGSAMKPFVMAAALEAGVVDLDERIDCENGSWVLGRRRIDDAHEHGVLSAFDVLVESSNIGMVKIATRLAPDGAPIETQRAGFRKLRDRLVDAGFGRKTDLGLPGESPGVLRSLRSWSRNYTLASMAFGHEMQVTALQLAAGFAVFANGGRYVAPRLVDRLIDPATGAESVARPTAERRVFTEHVVEQVKDALVAVIDRGTGTGAAIPGYSVAGKTSTAEHPIHREWHTCSFVGFAPASRPELLVVVVVDRPAKGGRFGGTVAAPAAREILARSLAYLAVEPDRRDDWNDR